MGEETPAAATSPGPRPAPSRRPRLCPARNGAASSPAWIGLEARSARESRSFGEKLALVIKTIRDSGREQVRRDLADMERKLCYVTERLQRISPAPEARRVSGGIERLLAGQPPPGEEAADALDHAAWLDEDGAAELDDFLERS